MVRRRRRLTHPRPAWRLLVLDSGGLSAIATNDEDARAALRNSVRSGVPVIVPSVVLAESLQGTGADARVNQVLNGVRVVPVREQEARLGARLKHAAARSGVEETIDALVVATAAAAGGGAILTSDDEDLGALAEAVTDATVRVIRV